MRILLHSQVLRSKIKYGSLLPCDFYRRSQGAQTNEQQDGTVTAGKLGRAKHGQPESTAITAIQRDFDCLFVNSQNFTMFMPGKHFGAMHRVVTRGSDVGGCEICRKAARTSRAVRTPG